MVAIGVGEIPDIAKSNPKAIGKSKCAAPLTTSTEAKVTAMRFGSKARPVDDQPARNHPRNSETTLFANPTTAIAGKPFAIYGWAFTRVLSMPLKEPV